MILKVGNYNVVNFDTLYNMVQGLKTVQELTNVSITEPYRIAQDMKSNNIDFFIRPNLV